MRNPPRDNRDRRERDNRGPQGRDRRDSTRVNLDDRVITEGGETLVKEAEQLGEQTRQGEI